MPYKAPRAAARQSALEAEAGAYAVLGLIQAGTVGAHAFSLDYHPEDVLQQVELVRSKVVEITAPGNVGLQTPRKGRPCE